MIPDTVLADLGVLPLAGILLVAFAAGLLRGFSGFGSSLLVVPTLGLVIGPAPAVVIGTLLEALATAMLVPSCIAHTSRSRLLTMGPAACVAIPLGHFALIELDPALSNLAISMAVVVMSAMVWRQSSLRLTHGRRGDIGAGVVSGFLTGFGSIGGPPLVLYILAGVDSATRKRADIVVVAGIAQAAAFVSMLFFGLLTFGGAGGAVLLAPAFFLGGTLGNRLFLRASEDTYQRVALGALLAAALLLLCVNLVRLLR